MTDDALLDRLAELAGIEPRYRDETGKMRTTSVQSKRGVLDAMGFAVRTRSDMEHEVHRLEAGAWRQVAPPVLVVPHAVPPALPVTLPAGRTDETLQWDFTEEDGRREAGEASTADLTLTEAASVDGVRFERKTLVLPIAPSPGYHMLRIREGDTNHEVPVVVTKERCYIPAALSVGTGAWGIAAQLYALRSPRNWGIGDFTDLCEFARAAAAQGASAIGLNPLHAVSVAHPGRASPYSPSSRVLFNVIYIDVEACPEFAECEAARVRVGSDSFRQGLARLRAEPLVDYPGVAAAKREILEMLYACFRSNHLNGVRGEAFRRYQAAGGDPLRRWAVFEALSEHFAASAGWWREWPDAFRNPGSAEVRSFADARADRVEFFEYLQWMAETQLASAAEEAQARGMSIGLYADLALGVDHDSADVWGAGDLYCANASIGAPPDVMNAKGQNWGIAPMNWMVLRGLGYQPFASVLRGGMRYGGALRIDHVMSLQRLYWIPRGADATEGAYVRQPFEDLIGVLAAESQRQRCMVIGEDLGTVPPGFRKRMQRARVLSYRPLFFQMDKQGEFIPSASYPRLSAAVVGTHDMATLPGYWSGRDLEVRRSLGLRDTRLAGEDDEFARRAREKRRLLDALVREGFLSDLPTDDDVPLDDDLVRAIHRFLASAPSRLVMVRPEDALAIMEQQNLPGTVEEHPNWRLKFPLDIQGLAADARLRALTELLRRERPEHPLVAPHPAESDA